MMAAGGGPATMLRPGSVALIGATDRSRWSSMTFQNLTTLGFAGTVHLVNRRGGMVHGQAAAARCTALDATPDLGIVMVPMPAVADALADLAEAGTRNAVILTSGFAETGAGGAAVQAGLVSQAHAQGMRLLGPNSLGFINYLDAVPAWTAPCGRTELVGDVAVISQSGQVGHHLNALGRQQGVGLSHLVTTGNEADLDFADFALHFVADPRVRAIALFLETIRHPARFAEAARRALEAGKPIVVFKIGASEVAARTAQAHTGALVGDDRIFDGVCRQYGVVRVSAVEDLFTTANLLARTGVLRPGGVGLISNSGGICGIAADTATAQGIVVPDLSPPVVAALRAVLPDYATAQNPLDITGASTLDRSLFETTVRAMVAEPAFAAAVCFTDLPETEREADPLNLAGYRHMAQGLADARIPTLVMSCLAKPVSPVALGIIAELQLPFIAGGLQRGLAALGKAFWWSERQRRGYAPAEAWTAPPLPARRPRSEQATLDWLARCGVGVVPHALAQDPASAVAAARSFGGKVVLKVASADIAHKTEIGGVALDRQGDAEVTEAFHAVQAGAPAGARVDGVLVAPMRRGGLEVFVGVTRDPQWGPVIAVGLGGIWVEVLQDVALRPLPVAPAEARVMLEELRGAALLEGRRGIPAADLAAVAAAIARIGDAALALGPELDTLEVNPLWVRGEQVEALDALAVWSEKAQP